MTSGIREFIRNNQIASIACIDAAGKPYIFHCFYAFDEEQNFLFFKSSEATYHAKALNQNPNISGGILPKQLDFLKMKGIQFRGNLISNEIPDTLKLEVFYHKKFPFALAKSGKVWTVRLDEIKMTDNTILFGQKLKWERYECNVRR